MTVSPRVIDRSTVNLEEGRPAVFFDRDGVLNVDKGYLFRPEDVEWIPGAIRSIRHFNKQGYLVLVVTNQSGIARGYYTEEDLHLLHQRMNEKLKSEGAHIDAFYFCPHHPEAAIEQYKINCDCRKPKAGMLQQAKAEWCIRMDRSFLIGDKPSDIAAAKAAGLPGYLFNAGNLFDFLLEIGRIQLSDS